jgi:hypothetical protein
VEQQTGMPLTGQEGPPCDYYIETINYSDAPDWMQERVVASAAMSAVLNRDVPPEELQAASQDMLENTEITINSKYGTWDQDAFMAQELTAVVPPVGPVMEGDGADDPASAAPGDGSAPQPPSEGDPGTAPDAGAAPPDAGAEPAEPIDPSEIDPDLVALLEDYGIDPGMLTSADLAAIEGMGMDPADLSSEELADLESQLQMSLGGGQPGGAPAP